MSIATSIESVESFVKRAITALEAWQHHPAAAEATAHLTNALDHTAEAKAAATPATAAAAPAAATTPEAPAATGSEAAAAATGTTQATEQEGAAGAQPTA